MQVLALAGLERRCAETWGGEAGSRSNLRAQQHARQGGHMPVLWTFFNFHPGICQILVYEKLSENRYQCESDTLGV